MHDGYCGEAYRSSYVLDILESWQIRPTVCSMENLSRALCSAAVASFDATAGSCMMRPTAKAKATGSADGTRNPS